MAPDTPKGVSSRLLTMKFMQRAVASASSSPQADDSSQSSKKRKLKHSAAAAAEERVSALIDQASIKAALEDQEAKRQAALAQHTASGAHWVLNTKLDKLNGSAPPKPSLNVVYVGYGDIDSDSESGEDAPQIGRTSTRKPKEVENQKPNSEKDDGSDDESSSDGEDSSRKRKERHSDAGDGSSRSRSQSRPRTRINDESKRAKDFREKRKKKEISLNKITSISSSGGASNSASSACYVCKQPGHKAVNCPKGGSKRS